jgi:RNA polymerase sigma-70 factor (ECF subfamily)
MKKFSNEWELLQGINERDKDAIEAFHNSVIKTAYTLAYGIVNNKFDAEELANDAFLITTLLPYEFESLQHAQNYVYKITRNKALNLINSYAYRKRQSMANELPEKRVDVDIGASIDRARILKEMKDLIDMLPDNDKLIMKLYLDDAATSEIASRLNKQNQYVLNRKAKIIKWLQKICKGKGWLHIFYFF